MKTLQNYLFVALFLFGLILITGCSQIEGPTSPAGEQALLKSQDGGVGGINASPGWWGRSDSRMVVILQGTAPAVPRDVPDIDGDDIDDPADCFDVDLVDAKTKRVIGTASECVAVANLDDQGPKPVATTTFNFFGKGTLVQRGKLSVQPVLWEPGFNPDVDPNVTFVTGAFPLPGTNNIISGTGRFADVTGTVRLSGAFTNNPDGTATLDCIFIIDLFDDDDDDDDDEDEEEEDEEEEDNEEEEKR